jgi:hypothetical protein
MSFDCKECGDSFVSLRSLHAHIKKHGKFLGDYYVENYARKDKLTGELIPFKKYDQYFGADFINGRNMKKWCRTAPRNEVKEFIIKAFVQKKEAKGLRGAPPSTYLQTVGIPDIDMCKEVFGSYSEACKQFGMLPMLSGQLPNKFTTDYSNTPILIDTREQKPLYFKNSEFLKLDVGDYAVGGDLYDYTFVDRKSYQDFCATVTNGYGRFIKELERCRSLGCFLFVVTETAFGDMWGENSRGYKKFRLDYVYHRMREIQAEYSDCCQFVFSGSREKSEEIIPKILVLGKRLWEVDVQYFWNKQLKENGLGRRQTKTPQRVQGYKPADSRQRGIFGGD